MNPRVKGVKILENYNLLLTFTNNEKRIFDVKPYLSIGIYKKLKDIEIFNSVKANDGSILWSNEADFCPDTLYLESKSF